MFSFDIGGIAPVRAKFPDKEIDEFTYPIPIIDSDPPKPYAKDVWNKFDADYNKVLEGSKYKTVILDTSTAIWEIIRHAVAEQVGQKKLLEVQYTLPNLRMNSLFTRAKVSGLNFVCTQYLRPIRIDGEATKELETDGWKRTEAQVDIVLWTARAVKATREGKKNVIMTTLKDNRFDLEICGMEIEDADYNKICALLGF
uniref:ATPase domain containing protein n=1 Tax=viral metagenome TaxID=1070528 RepID=A0A6M3KVG5_9ZZZZ